MALQGWRLFGVAGTIFAYIAGILFLSVINMQNLHPKRPRLGRFGEINTVRNRDMSGLNRRQPIQWCTELKFLDGTPLLSDETTKSSNAIPGNFVNKYKHFFKRSNSKRFVGDIDNNNNNSRETPYSKATSKNHSIIQKKIHKKSSTRNDVPVIQTGLTALASFPGSGNTWLRYLLQQSTGILTGSIYKDYGLLKSGFPAENICNKSVLVVKTHEWGPNAWLSFDKAILLVRDPEKAILAEFNRQSGGHVGFASPDRYKRTKGRYWQQFVSNKLVGWENMNLAWARNFTGSLKIVYYDDLVGDVEGTLREILSFLNYPINEDLLSCALIRKEGIYRRKKRVLSFDPYNPTMRKYIEEIKLKVYALLGRHT